MNYRFLPLLALLLSVGCSGNSSIPPAASEQNSSSQPASTKSTQQAQRIVALTPLGADLVYNLDKSKLVGVPGSTYIRKNQRFQSFPQVGERTGINLEKIVALKPDLVIGTDVFQKQVLDKLNTMGIATLTHNTSSWADLEAFTKTVGDRVGSDPKPILNQYQSCLGNTKPVPQSVLVLASTKPLLSPNKNSWAGDLLQKFQFKSLTNDLQSNTEFKGYLSLSPEKVLEKDPDMIFIIDSERVNVEEFKKLPFWGKLRATKNNQVYVFHHDGLISPTGVDVVKEVCDQLRQVAEQQATKQSFKKPAIDSGLLGKL